MSNADLKAEVREYLSRDLTEKSMDFIRRVLDALETQSAEIVALTVEADRAIDQANNLAGDVAALESQPAPLVADSREALARGIEAVDYYGLSIESKISERSYATADFLFASGVVSLAGDAKADGWDACQQVAETSCSCHPPKPWDNPFREITEAQWYADRNPYRESEGK